MIEPGRTRPQTTRTRWIAVVGLALAGVVSLVVAGCGVNASSEPVDVGDALGTSDSVGVQLEPPEPSDFTTAEGLVEGFLKASTGAGQPAVNNVKAFFTDRGAESWDEPFEDSRDVITVIRVTDPIEGRQKGGGIDVVVWYQTVGKLNNRGQLQALQEPAASPHSMTFRVFRSPSSVSEWRIDGVTGSIPPGLIISDEGLREYYSIQPIYFWDITSTLLVPDLRYIPRTISLAFRANRVVTLLTNGPSPMLGAVQELRSGTALDGAVVSNGDTIVVKLNPAAIAGDDKAKAADRLMRQLQWSLSIDNRPPNIELRIGNEQPLRRLSSDTSYRSFNAASRPLATTPQTFDVREEKVVAVDEAGVELPSQPAVLASKENKSVLYAAIPEDKPAAAFVVRNPSGGWQLQFVRVGGKAAPIRLRANSIGRPAWIPRTDVVLVPAGGRIRAVSSVSGAAPADITPHGVDNVTSVSISPDARRIAIVADGQVKVVQLSVDAQGVSIEGVPLTLPVSANLEATGVAWTSEVWLRIVGTDGGGSAMFEVTADGVVAVRSELKGFVPVGVVACPSQDRVAGPVYVLAPQAAYSGQSEAPFKAPFFAL